MAARPVAGVVGGNAARRHQSAWRAVRRRGRRGDLAAPLEPACESGIPPVGLADSVFVSETLGNPDWSTGGNLGGGDGSRGLARAVTGALSGPLNVRALAKRYGTRSQIHSADY